MQPRERSSRWLAVALALVAVGGISVTLSLSQQLDMVSQPKAPRVPDEISATLAPRIAFAEVPEFPGVQFEDASDQPVSADVIKLYRSSTHCEDLHSVLILQLGWPPGTPDPSGASARHYARDPGGLIGDRWAGSTFEADASIPDAATSTGYRWEAVEIWLDRERADTELYVVYGGRVERWPLVEQGNCA